jgi:hypothetical protein
MASKRARRRRRGKHQAKYANIDRMNRAMGEFLTAQGRVELTMVLLLMQIRDEDYEWLFDEMSKRTFFDKIVFFKTYTSDDDQFTPENRVIREQIYKDLDDLLPQRNSIVHGETYEYQFDGRPKQPYRLGVIKKNIKYIEDFTMDKHGPNVFTVKGVKNAAALGDRIWRNINKIRGVGQSPWD